MKPLAQPGVMATLVAAVLFGAGTPLAKLLLAQTCCCCERFAVRLKCICLAAKASGWLAPCCRVGSSGLCC